MNNNLDTHDCLFKIIVIGDQGTGKSCILSRYTDNTFSTTSIATIGIDFRSKTLTIDGTQVKLQIWDTAGQERFRTITTAYYRGADAVILVYDVCDIDSFHNITQWKDAVLEYAPKQIKIILVGNKCDMKIKRAVSTEEGLDLAKELRIMFVEVSAKTGKNISRVFVKITKSMLRECAKLKHAKDIIDLNKQSVGYSCTDSMKCTLN